MASQARARKLADRVREIVAETLEHRIKDPRLGFVTITDARVTADLRDATVFYTVLGEDEERASTAAALESAKGVLRTEVGRQTGIKHTPSLTFVLDALPDNARHLDDLLRAAAESDAAVHARAAGAAYAGDADPYRHRGDDEAEPGEQPSDGQPSDGQPSGGQPSGGQSGRDQLGGEHPGGTP